MMGKINLLLSTIVALGFLSACSVHEPHQLSTNQVQAVKDYHEETINYDHLSGAAVAYIADQYDRYGTGVFDLVLTYNPLSRVNTASIARNNLNDLVSNLQRAGVDELRADLLPLSNGSDDLRVVISYPSVSAAAPKDCDTLNGLHDRNAEIDPDYRFGCGRDTIFARQIAKPKHLLGHSDSDGLTEGRRAANIVETYRTGVPNASLGGESASGD